MEEALLFVYVKKRRKTTKISQRINHDCFYDLACTDWRLSTYHGRVSKWGNLTQDVGTQTWSLIVSFGKGGGGSSQSWGAREALICGSATCLARIARLAYVAIVNLAWYI